MSETLRLLQAESNGAETPVQGQKKTRAEAPAHLRLICRGAVHGQAPEDGEAGGGLQAGVLRAQAAGEAGVVGGRDESLRPRAHSARLRLAARPHAGREDATKIDCEAAADGRGLLQDAGAVAADRGRALRLRADEPDEAEAVLHGPARHADAAAREGRERRADGEAAEAARGERGRGAGGA